MYRLLEQVVWMNAPDVNGKLALTKEHVLVLVLCACLASENSESILMLISP